MLRRTSMFFSDDIFCIHWIFVQHWTLPHNYKICCSPFLFNLFHIFQLLFIVSYIFFILDTRLVSLYILPLLTLAIFFLALHYIVLKTRFSCSMFHYCSTIQWFPENINFFLNFFMQLSIFPQIDHISLNLVVFCCFPYFTKNVSFPAT